ncbi:MAG: outer membrane protein assembly factor BamB [Verrucomicrobiales bacterium]|jgi:outer membrane protein assembly factor BamB
MKPLMRIGLALAALQTWASADDWPAWRHDAGRSGVTSQQLPAEMHLQWSRQLPPLTPAWAEDVRLQFDSAYQPIVVGKLMIVASSLNDSVSAYETKTGKLKWRFFADAPVRFAPVASGGSIYFGADDGCLYRVSETDGALISKWNATPSDRLALGNDRLISVWPVRGGPVVVDDRIYFTIGVWPFEGTYLTSVKLNDETAQLAPLTPLDDSSPQGYLASNGKRLVIPRGRANVLCRDLATGKAISLKYRVKGDYHAIAHENWMVHAGGVVRLDTGVAVAPDFTALRPLISDGKTYFAKDGKVLAFDLKNLKTVEKTDRKGNAITVQEPPLLWSFADQAATKVHLKAGQQIFCHHKDRIFAIEVPAADGAPGVSFSASIEGTCASMLAADGKLFVVTEEGKISCFGPSEATAVLQKEAHAQLPSNTEWRAKATEILEQSKEANGYCLALGIGSGGLVEELARQSKMKIIVIDPDADRIREFRQRWDGMGLYGTRIVAKVGALGDLRLPPYFASLIVSEAVDAGEFAEEIFRILRPYGGVACLENTAKQHDDLAAASQHLPKAVVAHAGSLTTLTREGALPGSANWTHEYGDAGNTLTSSDTLVKAPLGVLWFGGPAGDGDLFYNRHYWGPSMAVIQGRMFVQGPDKLTAIDIYTGRILWKIPLQEEEGNRAGRQGWNFETKLAGFHFVASDDSLYLVDGREIVRIDPVTGAQLAKFTNPDEDAVWGRVRAHEDLLIVSVFHGAGSAEKPPTEIVALDKETGEVRWSKKADQGFPVFALGEGKLFCFDGGIEQYYDIRVRRGALPKTTEQKTIKAVDLKSGEVLWEKPTDIIATWLSYSSEHDVMVVSNKENVAAFRGKTGNELWREASVGVGFKGHPENYWDKVIIWKDRILDQRGPGLAYDLETGKRMMSKHPITGESTPWSFTKSGHHCNYAIASEHLMTFRAADAGFCDLESGGTSRLTGFRSGCRNSLIPAGGVLNAPNFAFGCSCGYSLFTSLALINTPESDLWTYSSLSLGDGPLKRVGINLGGRGDRKADNGTLWMDYPNVGGASPKLPIKLAGADLDWFRLPSTQIDGDGLKWVAASGANGLESITVPVIVGKEGETAKSRTFTVTLSFVEPADGKTGDRIFDVLVQGKTAIAGLDVWKETGGSQRLLVKEIRGVQADSEILISFAAKTGRSTISGVEVIEEVNP